MFDPRLIPILQIAALKLKIINKALHVFSNIESFTCLFFFFMLKSAKHEILIASKFMESSKLFGN